MLKQALVTLIKVTRKDELKNLKRLQTRKTLVKKEIRKNTENKKEIRKNTENAQSN